MTEQPASSNPSAVALGARLFAGPQRRVTSGGPFKAARAAGAGVRLATVYNTLQRFGSGPARPADLQEPRPSDRSKELRADGGRHA